MHILVTGNQGYIGAVLTKMLLEKGYKVTGLDTDYYQGCNFDNFNFGINPVRNLSLNGVKQIKKDIREVTKNDLIGVEAICHLAALSNDPLGEFEPKLTEDINFRATLRLARLAKEMKIKRFIYASSCSMYGIAGDEPVSEESILAPATAYAVSKVNSEKVLSEMADRDFSPVFLRPSTAYGLSPMLRCDLAVNNLTGWAFTTGKIKIMSDGTPWRPVIHIEDFCQGFIACLEAPIELVHNQAFNLGQNSENYQIREIAEQVKEIIPGCEIEYTGEHGSDSRTYKVNFDKINNQLKDYFQPKWKLPEGIKQLYDGFKFHGLTLEEFTNNKYIRLNHLKKLVAEKKLDEGLFWEEKPIGQAVILAGGRGERLSPLTDNMPKPMIKVCGRPFLEHLIEMLKENGIKKVLLLLGYLPEKITEYFGSGEKFGINIKYSISDVSDETGTRIKKAEKLLQDTFLLLYCDNYWPFNLKKLSRFYNSQKTMALVTVYTNKDLSTKNNILVNEEGFVSKYDKSRQDPELNGVEIGYYLVNKKILGLFPDYNFNFEKEILPKLISKKQLSGYLTDHKYYSISDPERIKTTEEFLLSKKAVFLDRDGVINKKPKRADYVKSWEEFEWLPGAIEGLKLLSGNNYDIYFISNQPGIARGMMTKEDLDDIQKKLRDELAKHNIEIKGEYFCLHGWDDNCECRKPKPGLLFRAARDHKLDLTKSILIGDDERDISAGEEAGCRTIFLESGKNLLDIVKSEIITRAAEKGEEEDFVLFA